MATSNALNAPTDEEIVKLAQEFVAERSRSGVKIAESVSVISCQDGILSVVFDPAKVGFTVAKFRQINTFENLAEFIAGPIAETLPVPTRLREYLVRIDTALPDGESLGALTLDEMRKQFNIE
ncbi:hypothetical protein ABH922_002813 [Rhodococcus sp. 27YEA15]|uniref:hypothetical protein n=1 Tax=Rhodococcus sp. 27YEA15 TaxID=3156259 RepID=UPI003C7DDD18